MKQLVCCALLALAGATTARAQYAVPQGGFENWATRGPALAPTGWLTTDDVTTAAGLPFAIGNVQRSGSSHGGAYAVEMRNATFSGITFPGFVALGNTLTGNFEDGIPSGLPYTGRPARMEFYYKLTGPNVANDSAIAHIMLTRTTAAGVEVVGGGILVLTTAAPTYTLGTVPLQYQAAGQPDTVRILFGSGAAQQASTTTVLTVDDVVLAGMATATRDAAASAALSVYPTGSDKGLFTLAADSRPALLQGSLSVSDATGRVVLRQGAAPTAPSRSLDLRGQAPGLYVLRLDTPTGPLTRKLVVL